MKILIVAATWMEVKLLDDEIGPSVKEDHLLKSYQVGSLLVDILVAGIGSVFTAFHLANVLCRSQYNLVINMGICGSFTSDLIIGQVVNVVTDQFADLGIEHPNQFLTLFQAGFLKSDDFPFEQGKLKSSFELTDKSWVKVNGITTNTSSGRRARIEELKTLFNAQVESMEGAAVFYVCAWSGIPVCQLRAVSNYVEPRDSSKWNIPLALENLKSATIELFNVLQVKG